MKIFISYSQKDKEIVYSIYKKIKDEYGRNNVFLDIEKNEIEDNYWQNIDCWLKKSTHFILFNSINYVKSVSCGNELCIALDLINKLKIIEIKLDETKSHNLLKGRIYYNHVNKEETVD